MADYNELDIAVLKTLLNNRKHALEFVHENNEKLFATELHRFAKLVIDYIRVYKQTPTKRVIIEKLRSFKDDNLFAQTNEILAKIEAFNYDDKEYEYDLEKIKNRFSNKLIVGLKDSLSNTSNIDLKHNINNIQSALNNIKSVNQPKAYKKGTLKETINDFKNRYVAKLENPNFSAGIDTGYSFFDYVSGGIRPSEMLLVGAETGGGKSLLLMNMAINMWLHGNTVDMEKDFKEGNDVLYFSLEMPYDDMEERLYSRLSMVPQKYIRDAKVEDDGLKKLSRVSKFIENYPWEFEIVDMPRGASIETIELLFNETIAKKRKPKVVVIDYLTLMDYKEEVADDWLKQGKISEQMHEFGRVHEIVMLSAVQLNDAKANSGKTEESKIGIHRTGRSKQIMHNANFAFQIEKRPSEEQYPDMNLHLIKSRRTELTRGKVHKNFSCCALLNDPTMSVDVVGDPEDISAQISQSKIE